MKIFLILFAVLISIQSFGRKDTAQPGSATEDSSAEPVGPYGAYVGCLNRMKGTAIGLVTNPNTWDAQGQGPDREPVLFYNSKNDGFYYVTDQIATFDKVEKYKPEGNWMPFYPVLFKRSDGGISVIHLMEENGRVSSSATSGHPEEVLKIQKANPKAKYKQIGLAEARIDDAKKVHEAFAEEIVPLLATFKKTLSYKVLDEKFLNSRYGHKVDYVAKFMANAKDAFCACVKTERSEIISAVANAAKDIGLSEDEYKKCREIPVAENILLDWSILPHAYAETLPSQKLHFQIAASGVDQLAIEGDKVVLCQSGKGKTFDLKQGKSQVSKCLAPVDKSSCDPIGKDARHCVKSGSMVAGMTGAGIVLVDTKSKYREVFSQKNAKHIGLSDSWLAISDSNNTSVYKIK